MTTKKLEWTEILIKSINNYAELADSESGLCLLADRIHKHPDFPDYIFVAGKHEEDIEIYRHQQAWSDVSGRQMFDGEEVMRPIDAYDAINRFAAVIKIHGIVAQILIKQTRQAESLMPRIGIVTIICDELTRLVWNDAGTRYGPVTRADLARVVASHDSSNGDGLERWRRYLCRLDRGEFVSSSMVVSVSRALGLSVNDIAFSSPAIYENERRRRGTARQRACTIQAERRARMIPDSKRPK